MAITTKLLTSLFELQNLMVNRTTMDGSLEETTGPATRRTSLSQGCPRVRMRARWRADDHDVDYVERVGHDEEEEEELKADTSLSCRWSTLK